MRIPVATAAAALLFSFHPALIAADCPSAVTAAVLKAHPGATVTKCKKETEDGRTQFEVKIDAKGGQLLELDVSPDGTILLTEETIPVGAVPAEVMKAFTTKYASATPTRAEKQTTADGKVTYELAFLSGKTKKEATFAADGTFTEEE